MSIQMKYRPPAGWHDYQEALKRQRQQRRRLGRTIGAALMIAAMIALLFFVYQSNNFSWRAFTKTPQKTNTLLNPSLAMDELKALLADQDPIILGASKAVVASDKRLLHMTTTINVGLQKQLTDRLMLRTSAYIGIVVMDAFNGKILAVASHDRSNPRANTCLNNRFPAASIFKIVTAAAAMENARFTPSSIVTYTGGKHTLYKNQITEKIDRHTTTTTLQKAFAGSINPVFGKLGAFTLKNASLIDFAHRFGFERPLDVTLPLAPGAFVITDQPYQWAELASGYNGTTTLSPLQGAMIAAATVNEGQWVTPRLIESVTADNGKIRYQLPHLKTKAIVTQQTARHLRTVMQATILEGTGRKTFRGWQNDPVLSKLKIGGKTGSYNNNPRYDWFVGFGLDPEKNHAVAVSVLVGHQDLIGTRAGEYARTALKYHFKNQQQSSQS